MSVNYETESIAGSAGETCGELKIADEVVATIAALAATEADGVAYLAGNTTREVIARLGMKSLSKGVAVEVENGTVSVQITLVIEYGCSVPKVSAKVQDRVKSAIENMTGLKVDQVKVTVSGIHMEN